MKTILDYFRKPTLEDVESLRASFVDNSEHGSAVLLDEGVSISRFETYEANSVTVSVDSFVIESYDKDGSTGYRVLLDGVEQPKIRSLTLTINSENLVPRLTLERLLI